MALLERRVKESPVYMGSSETLAFTIALGPIAGTNYVGWSDISSPSAPANTLYSWPDMTDVSATNLTGSPSFSGTNLTTSSLKALTVGQHYLYRCTFTDGGLTKSVTCIFIGEQ